MTSVNEERIKFATSELLLGRNEMTISNFNRRAFLLSGGATALIATGGLGTSRNLFAQLSNPAYDPAVLDNATSTHAAVISRSWNGVGTPNDILALSQANASVVGTFSQNNFDAKFKAQIANISSNQLSMTANDYSGAISRIQTYAPGFGAADFQQLMAYLANDPDSVASALASLKQNGLSPIIQSTAVSYAKLAKALALQQGDQARALPSPFRRNRTNLASLHSSNNKILRTALYDPTRDRAHLNDASWQRMLMTLQDDPGTTTGYSCAADGMAGLSYGTAVAVVAVMCFVSVIGDVLCLPVFAIWAGTAGAGWALGHAMKCNF